MHPGSKAWQLHTNSFEKETVPAGIRLHYADPEKLTIPEYVLYGQMFQAILHGHAMEALRFRKYDPVDDCQGALIWSYRTAGGRPVGRSWITTCAARQAITGSAVPAIL